MSRTKVTTSTPGPSPTGSRFNVLKLLLKLGPGLITGAADDDPSGIATYSQVGAKFGYGMLWVMPFSYPLMAVIQEISARIGRVTGVGIAAEHQEMIFNEFYQVNNRQSQGTGLGRALLAFAAALYDASVHIGGLAGPRLRELELSSSP